MPEYKSGTIVGLEVAKDNPTRAIMTVAFPYSGDRERYVIWWDSPATIRYIWETHAQVAVSALESVSPDLVISVASQPGTDEHGHEYGAGIKIHDQAATA